MQGGMAQSDTTPGIRAGFDNARRLQRCGRSTAMQPSLLANPVGRRRDHRQHPHATSHSSINNSVAPS